VNWRLIGLAQWQAWLRHSRGDAPSVQELLQDQQRQDRIKELAKAADERWKTLGQQSTERLAVKSPEEAVRGIDCLLGGF